MRVGEVVPAREGLRQLLNESLARGFSEVGEVVPAREGLRQISKFVLFHRVIVSERLFQLEKD